jgi:hypothetical protein
MHKHIILFFWLTLIFSACEHADSDKTIIKRDEMISLLTDMHIVDGGLYNMVSINPDSLYKYGTGRYLALFKRHHVDSTMFRSSLKYYTARPVEFETMYDEILKHLASKTDSANKSLLKSNYGQRPKAE